MHRLVCRTKFNIFLPDNPCRKVELAESRFMNGELLKNNPVVIFQFNEELLPYVVHGIWKKKIPRTSRTIAKVTNILKALAITINMKWVE